MSIKQITTDDLRRMNDSEGIIFQGCGGDPQEWVDGINELLTENKILLNGTKFTDAYQFQHEAVTCLLFPFSLDVQLDIGKLAMWRLGTHSQFGGTWLSDFVENNLAGFQNEERVKPDCPLLNQDGNIFNLLGIASRTLKQNGMKDEATEMCSRVTSSGSYYEALGIIGEYVNITDGSESEDFDEGQGMSL